MTDPDTQATLDANAPAFADPAEPTSVPEQTRPDLTGVRGIYLDLDDTLCGYWDASKAGLRETFELHRPEGRSVEEMVEAWARAFRQFAPTLKKTGWYEGYLLRGEPTRTEQMRRTLAEVGVEDEARAQAMSETYMRRRDANLKLFPDATAVLDILKARYPLGLITNGPADIQRQEIGTLGIESYFAHVYIEGEMGEGKPLRTVFDRAASAMGLEPSQLLMVGNSFAHDITPAIEYGWHAIWVRRPSDVPPSATKGEEMPEGARTPDAVIGHLTELLDLLPKA